MRTEANVGVHVLLKFREALKLNIMQHLHIPTKFI